MINASKFLLTAGLGLLLGTPANAADAESCKKVRLSDVGWTDIQVTTAATAHVLTALGYEPEITNLTVPVTFAAMKDNDIDVFLGNWMPSQSEAIKEYSADGSVETVSENLDGAGFGLVVPDYVTAAGVKTVSDLGKFKDKFEGKIYGIEAGSAGNKNIEKLIADAKNNLAGFELIDSSETGMLSQAERLMKDKEWVVFLGWTPHPIMGEMNIDYLGGMEESGFGGAKVFTNTRKGYLAECPNVGALVKNLKFTLAMENTMMDGVLKGDSPADVAKAWLKANPDAPTPWLAGVTAFDGSDALAAVKSSLAN